MARKEVKLKIRLDGKAEFKAELDKLIKESGANNLKFDTSSAIKSLNEFNKVLDEISEKIKDINISNINMKPMDLSSGIKEELKTTTQTIDSFIESLGISVGSSLGKTLKKNLKDGFKSFDIEKMIKDTIGAVDTKELQNSKIRDKKYTESIIEPYKQVYDFVKGKNFSIENIQLDKDELSDIQRQLKGVMKIDNKAISLDSLLKDIEELSRKWGLAFKGSTPQDNIKELSNYINTYKQLQKQGATDYSGYLSPEEEDNNIARLTNKCIELYEALEKVNQQKQELSSTKMIKEEVQAINKATEAQRKYNSVKSENPKTESVTNVFKDYGDGEGDKQIQTVTKLNNGLGQTVKLTQDLINNTTTTSDTTNYKKQSDSIDKMNERVLKLIQSMNLMKDTNLFDKSVFNNSKGNGYLDELKGLDKNINVSNIDKATASVEKLEQKSKDMSTNSKRIVEITKSFETLKDLKLSDNFAKLDETQIKQYNDQLKSTTDLLKKLKGNSDSVNDISYSQGLSGLKDTTKDLSSSIKEIDKYGETIDKLKSKMQGGVTKLGANSFLDDSVITDLQNRLNSINTNSSEEEIKQLEQEIKNLGSSDSQIVRVQSSLSKMKSNLEGMKGKYQGLVGDKDSIAQLEKYNSEIKKLEGLLRDLQSGKTFTGTKISSELNQASEASRNLSNAVKNSSSALKLSQQDAQSFGNSIKRAFANAGMYTSVYEVIQLTARALKEGIKTVIEMDSALADLNKVVDLTKTQLGEMKDSAVAMGKEFGVSAIQVSQAQAEFGKAYKDTNDINTLTKTSLLGANVMDGETSSEVAKNLTTIITAMKKEVGDSMVILDSMNEIQNNYRISASDMADALSETASTGFTSGASLERLEGYITAIATSTGESGSEVGNAFFKLVHLKPNLIYGEHRENDNALEDYFQIIK